MDPVDEAHSELSSVHQRTDISQLSIGTEDCLESFSSVLDFVSSSAILADQASRIITKSCCDCSIVCTSSIPEDGHHLIGSTCFVDNNCLPPDVSEVGQLGDSTSNLVVECQSSFGDDTCADHIVNPVMCPASSSVMPKVSEAIDSIDNLGSNFISVVNEQSPHDDRNLSDCTVINKSVDTSVDQCSGLNPPVTNCERESATDNHTTGLLDSGGVPSISCCQVDTGQLCKKDEVKLSVSDIARSAKGGTPALDAKSALNGKKISAKAKKKKEDKAIDDLWLEYILRALSSLSSPEEKLAALCKKYADLHEEHRLLQSSGKQQQCRSTMILRERDQLQTDHTKAVMAKSKLESLCRELQKQNKFLKEEGLLRVKVQEEKRKEISLSFQKTVEDVLGKMEESQEVCKSLQDQNVSLIDKMGTLLERNSLQEQQMQQIGMQHDLEHRLADAKLKQAQAVLEQEQYRHSTEVKEHTLMSMESHQKIQGLEAMVAMYKERYEEFQAAVTRSNEVFQRFKSEMEKMAKRIQKLEKEGAYWKSKWEGNNRSLCEMTEEKLTREKEMQLLQTKLERLQSLCRALHSGKVDNTTSGNHSPATLVDTASTDQVPIQPVTVLATSGLSDGETGSMSQYSPSTTALTELPSAPASTFTAAPRQ